ncbi:hypothetical protein Y032_0088g2184 [Ancylostoma ceylanicum]|uniref:Hexosyltransferase n=1 Tax=Ancylostoma ceylanicum TaxID=53326 RepID=A0A016TPK8_9BILA|nr:hypothetical protein Y032_0088g2184 [Ancylostoma ceylanicum]
MSHRQANWNDFRKFDLVRFPVVSATPYEYGALMRAYLLVVCLASVSLARHYIPIFLGSNEPPYLIKDDTRPLDLRFRFIIEPHVRVNVQLLVIVNSLPHDFIVRQRIRDSWAMPDLYDETSTKVVFLVGNPESLEEQEMLAIEEGHFHDVVVASIDEDYYSLSLKTYAMLLYKNTRFPKAKCLVKADSDNVLLVRSFERLCDETSMVRFSCSVKQLLM